MRTTPPANATEAVAKPVPPEGYRLITDAEKLHPLPSDVLCAWLGGSDQKTTWHPSAHRGVKLPESHLSHHYATAQPTPDGPTAGDSMDVHLKAARDEIALLQQQLIHVELSTEALEIVLAEKNAALSTAENKARELEKERAALADYLWPDPGGVPNTFRDILLAVRTRDRLARNIFDEVDAFVKHVGAPNFKEAVDVLLRTKHQDEDAKSEMHRIIKETGAALTAAETKAGAMEEALGTEAMNLRNANAELLARTETAESAAIWCRPSVFANLGDSGIKQLDAILAERNIPPAPSVAPIGKLPFDLAKVLGASNTPIVTRDGSKVKIYAVRFGGEYCIEGLVNGVDYRWLANGRRAYHHEDPIDLFLAAPSPTA